MTNYEIAGLAGQIELATKNAVEAALKQDWPTFDSHLEKISELRARMPEARTIGSFILNDTTGNTGRSNIILAVEKFNLALTIHPEGMGTWDGPYAPILLERHVGSVRLIVWADIHQQDPTHVIDMSEALESNRHDTD